MTAMLNQHTLLSYPISGSLINSNNYQMKEFYSNVFNWDFAVFNDFGQSSPDSFSDEVLLSCHQNGSEIALVSRSKNTSDLFELTGWQCHVSVEDLPKAVAKVIEFGGKIIDSNYSSGGFGPSVIVADSSGATIRLVECLETSFNNISTDSLDWIELETHDVDSAKRFYSEVVGWEHYDVCLPTGPYSANWCYTVFTKNGQPVAGLVKPLIETTAASWCIGFRNDDLNSIVRRVVENGGVIMDSPYESPVGKQATMIDPQGAMFSIIDRIV